MCFIFANNFVLSLQTTLLYQFICIGEPKPEDYPVLPSHLSHQDRDKLKIDTEVSCKQKLSCITNQN